jgi:anti-anti-sigma factor
MVEPSEASGDSRCLHCGHLEWFRKQEINDFLILNLLPGMNPEHADLERVGELLATSHGARHVVINFANVEFVSSTFLGRLLAMQKKLNAAEGKLVLCGLNEVVREVFQITRLEGLFDFADDQDAATGGT